MRRRARAWLALAAAGCVISAAPLACTREEEHRVLTFFFDGVPPLHPEEGLAATTRPAGPDVAVTGPRVGRPRPVLYEHKPGTDKAQCGVCHSRAISYGLVRPAADLCVSCHEAETRAFPRMHGPVAIGDCAACHEPHESRFEHLVHEPAPGLCFRCHQPAQQGGEAAGCMRASDAAACGDCHHPHGAGNRFFLTEADGRPNREALPASASESEAR